ALFIAGALSARAYLFYIESGAVSERIGERSLTFGACAITAGICALDLLVDVKSLSGAYSKPPVGLPYAYLLLLLATALALPFAFHFSRIVRIDRYLGELSYPVYISHY